ncbi:PTS sugar transporter subunit IIA [Clostridium tarantellae]|uniref:PTS sugar transporter subunit IIA n=1 Tax=Clostridium tarantellae TaxID=39493 RepID=A0A6I1MPS4_9CLOT|nr:PTS sugar transporter subunit IIA [Clostridium tarantellae]MPQ44910.1 PTS sugar transporter subunit IIA [Clostridium tarantellae]
MISKFLDEDVIELDVNVENWEEAVKKAGELLVKKGLVQKEYVQAMINTVKEMGAYIVISEGIAMPHGRPEDGVNAVGVSLITLKTPVEFGNKEYDPVKVVICLCAKNHESHIELLKNLMVVLEDDEFVKKIDLCKSKKDIIDLLERYK